MKVSRRSGKGGTCQTLEQAAKVLAENGIAAITDFSFILGLPWETQEEVKKTIRFATHLFVEYRRPRHDPVVPADSGFADLGGCAARFPASRIHVRRLRVLPEPLSVQDLVQADSEGNLRDRGHDRPTALAGRTDRTKDGRRSCIIFPRPISDAFPRDMLDVDDGGLSNLRAIAHPPRAGSLKLEGVRS